MAEGTAGLQIRAYFNPSWNAVELYALSGDGKSYATDIQFTLLPEPGAMTEPMARITPETAQTLANSLWDAGFRPVGAAGSIGQAAAMQAHIDDLRMVAKSGLLLVDQFVAQATKPPVYMQTPPDTSKVRVL